MTDKISVPIRCEYDELKDINGIVSILDQDNANTHTSEDIKDMAMTLAQLGWEHPIVIATHPERKNPYVQYGNKRAQAAKLAGFTHAPVVFRHYESADIANLTGMADNAHAQRSKMDLGVVNLKLESIDGSLPLEVIGIKNLQVDVADRYTQEDTKNTKTKTCPKCGENIWRGIND